jgi:hypothetical protein
MKVSNQKINNTQKYNPYSELPNTNYKRWSNHKQSTKRKSSNFKTNLLSNSKKTTKN